MLPSGRDSRIFFVDTDSRAEGAIDMRVQVQKWGNSLALRIPKPVAEDAGIRVGTVVDVAVSRGRVVATPVAPAAPKLEELLRRVTKRNVHREIETGPRSGREAW